MGLTLPHFDAAMCGLMEEWGLPGGAIAVARRGQLVFSAGYGLAADGVPMEASRRFRMASLSKTITAAAAVKLHDQGQLDLDAPVLRLLGTQAARGDAFDPRVFDITVRDLLRHTAGLDDKLAGYPPPMLLLRPGETLDGVAPPTRQDVVDYLLGLCLVAQPGTQFVFSTMTYCILGRVIEAVTGEAYGEHVRRDILTPLGLQDRIVLGRTRAEDCLPDEVTYYDAPGAPPIPVEYDAAGALDRPPVPRPYGEVLIEKRDSMGGWVASPIDFVRLVDAYERVLSPAALATMTEVPRTGDRKKGQSYYGMGWFMKPATVPLLRQLLSGSRSVDSYAWGALAGITHFAVRTADGCSWIVSFNTRPYDWKGWFSAMEDATWEAFRKTRRWPPGVPLD